MSGGWSRASSTHYQMGRSGRNPFVLRLASNYASAQGGALFQLIPGRSGRTLPNTRRYIYRRKPNRLRASTAPIPTFRATIGLCLRYEKSLEKCRRAAITAGEVYESLLIKPAWHAECGSPYDVLPIYAAR